MIFASSVKVKVDKESRSTMSWSWEVLEKSLEMRMDVGYELR